MPCTYSTLVRASAEKASGNSVTLVEPGVAVTTCAVGTMDTRPGSATLERRSVPICRPKLALVAVNWSRTVITVVDTPVTEMAVMYVGVPAGSAANVTTLAAAVVSSTRSPTSSTVVVFCATVNE